jgi:hypothetical protein
MQQRSARQEWNQTLPVFFIRDEFQEIVSINKDGLSDLNFWDKSRSSKTIGIISAQAISIFYAANAKVSDISTWVVENNIHILNEAGPQASQDSEIYNLTYSVLQKLLTKT